MRAKLFLIALGLIISIAAGAQGFVVDGYTFETGNRGYLSQVDLKVTDKDSGQVLTMSQSDVDGHFVLDLPPVKNIVIEATKEMFKSVTLEVTNTGKKEFVKLEMERAPGYLFEITLADKKDSVNQVVDALTGTLIEVYNNTTKKEVLVLKDHPTPEFKLNLEKGNHYTILVRKRGYLAKQMEAFVNVRGCILCFEGISDVRPGVSDNLTAGNEYGSLVANVEMDKLYSGKSFAVDNIYYDLNSANLKESSRKELDKVVNVLKYNPNLTLELGSHTDSRGRDEYNQKLSEKRAKAAVDYILKEGDIPTSRIYSVGYGERYLKNECSDGVKCSDEEHAKNRRTEIKVVGIEDEWIFKPLVNIKAQEQFEAQLRKELGEQLEEEQKKPKYKDIEGEKYYKDTTQQVETKEVEEVKEEVKETVKEKVEPEEEVVEKAKDVVKSETVAKKDEMVKDSIWIEGKETITKRKKLEAGSERSQSKFVPDEKEVLEQKTSDVSSTKVRDAMIEKSDRLAEEVKKDLDEVEEDVEDVMPTKSYGDSKITDGFKVVIHLADHPLTEDHIVHKKHENLEIYRSPTGYYYYLIPGFDTKGEAQSAIDTKYLALYPTAYVARFHNGVKI